MTNTAGFLSLGTGTASFVEETGTGYVRQAVSLFSIGTHITSNVAGATFSATGTNWGTVTQLGFSISLTSPILFSWNVDGPTQKAVANGSSFILTTNQLNLYLADAWYNVPPVIWPIGSVLGYDSTGDIITTSASFQSSGGAIVGGNSIAGNGSQIGYLNNANVLSTNDQLVTMVGPGTSYVVAKVIVTNATGNVVSLAGGVYAGPGADGGNVVSGGNANTQFSTLTAANKYINQTLGTQGNANVFSTPLRVHFTTAALAAGTVDFHIVGEYVG